MEICKWMVRNDDSPLSSQGYNEYAIVSFFRTTYYGRGPRKPSQGGVLALHVFVHGACIARGEQE